MACCGPRKVTAPKYGKRRTLDAEEHSARAGWAHSGTTISDKSGRRPSKDHAVGKRGKSKAPSRGSKPVETTESTALTDVNAPPFAFNWGNFDDYELKEDKLLGEGAYGKVYRAVKKRTNDQVVIKVFKKDKFNADRVKLEADVLVKVKKGPNMLKLLDMLWEPSTGTVMMATEFFDAMVHERLVGCIDLPGLQTYFRKLLQALEYAHKLRIMHRDIKGANVLYNPTTQGLRLIDWGFGKEIRVPMEDWPGTRWFKSPELFLHAPDYDGAVDMWAVGTLLGSMVFNKTPFFACDGPTNWDQFVGIFELLGTDDYVSYISNENTNVPQETLNQYLPDSFAFKDLPALRVDWETHFPKSDLAVAEVVDLMNRILQIDPSHRLTAKQALAHPFFKLRFNAKGKVETSKSAKAAGVGTARGKKLLTDSDATLSVGSATTDATSAATDATALSTRTGGTHVTHHSHASSYSMY